MTSQWDEGFPCTLPKRRLLTQLIEENAPKYERAPKWAGFVSEEHGCFIRSKHDIITTVVNDLMPSEEEGRFMIREGASWVVRVGFGSKTKEVCFLIQERFNKLILRTWNGNLPPLRSTPDQDDDDVQLNGDSNIIEELHPSQGGSALAPMDDASNAITGGKEEDSITSAGLSLNSILARDNVSATSQTTSTSASEILRNMANELPDNTRARKLSFSNESSIGTFSTSKEPTDDMVDPSLIIRQSNEFDAGIVPDPGTKRGRSGNTVNSTKRATHKRRFSEPTGTTTGVAHLLVNDVHSHNETSSANSSFLMTICTWLSDSHSSLKEPHPFQGPSWLRPLVVSLLNPSWTGKLQLLFLICCINSCTYHTILLKH